MGKPPGKISQELALLQFAKKGIKTLVFFLISAKGIRWSGAVYWKKKWSHFDRKSWVTGGTKIRPGIPSKWEIFESNWLSISSQFDSNTFQLLGIPGRILVQTLTQLSRSKWLHKGRGFMKIKGGFLFSVLLLDFEAIAEETMIELLYIAMELRRDDLVLKKANCVCY